MSLTKSNNTRNQIIFNQERDDIILPNFQNSDCVKIPRKIITEKENSRKMKMTEISISQKKRKLPKKFIV